MDQVRKWTQRVRLFKSSRESLVATLGAEQVRVVERSAADVVESTVVVCDAVTT